MSMPFERQLSLESPGCWISLASCIKYPTQIALHCLMMKHDGPCIADAASCYPGKIHTGTSDSNCLCSLLALPPMLTEAKSSTS